MSEKSEASLRYLADRSGEVTAVVVPIEVWREIESELETQHLLRSPAMRERLLQALERSGGYTLEDVLDALDLSEQDVGEESA